MTKKTFETMGVGILIGGVLLALVCFAMISDSSSSDSSSVEFTALSSEEMSGIVGGTAYKWNTLTQNQYPPADSNGPFFADCSDETPPCFPTKSNPVNFWPQVYFCSYCATSQNEYYRFDVYLLIKSWCKKKGANSCQYDSEGKYESSDCEYQTGTTC